MINSKQKGKRGELEFAKWIRKNLGIDVRRGDNIAAHLIAQILSASQGFMSK